MSMLSNKELKNIKSPLDRAYAQAIEFDKICKDPIYFIENYIWITDINKQGERIPFLLYSYQKDAGTQFSINRLNLTMKTRQTGLTTFSQAFTVWWMITKNKQICKCIANRKEISKKFLKGVREMLDNAREMSGEKKVNKRGVEYYQSWIIPNYKEGHDARESFGLENGSTIQAEGNTPEAGRGDSLHLCIIDEVASIDYQKKNAMSDIWASAGPAITRSKGTCIAISTPKGKSGWYFDQYINAEEKGWSILNASWRDHPIYNQGMYQWIKDDNNPEGGYLKMFNDEWQDTTHPDDLKKFKTRETYDYIKDGKIRSSWYDSESKKLGKERTACELDCSFSGSGGEVLDADVLKKISDECILPKRIGSINRDTELWWKNYYVYKEIEYIEEYRDGKLIKIPKKYLVVVDIATGDGSDSSTITVIDENNNEVVATFKDSNISPDSLAYLVKAIALEYGECEVVIEYQGPGIACLLKLKNDLNYPDRKIYRTKLKKSDPNEKDGHKSKLGYWQSNQSRTQGGDVLEEMINNEDIILNCKRIYKELETWVWREGRRDHLPGKHDDLIMTLTMYSYIRRYVREYYGVKTALARRIQSALITRTKLLKFSSKRVDSEGFAI